MLVRFLVGAGAVLGMVAVAVQSSSQDIQSGMGREDTGAPVLQAGPRTPFQQFADRLKLDAKIQKPLAEEVFAEASKEAAPVAQEMLQLRQRLVNMSLSAAPDETKPVVAAYTAAAAKMTGIEARAFAKVYVTLKPNQQAGASQAFGIMAGIFQPTMARGGGRGGRRGGERQ
jgi:hypothetical protein